MKYLYQKTNRFFAQVSTGMEKSGVAELSELGAKQVEPAFRGIHFRADHAGLYRANYLARTLTRILAPLKTFRCPDPDALYREARAVPWPEIFSVDRTFAVFANVSHSNISHSQFAGLRLKDAVVDRFRQELNRRPNIDPRNPDLWLNLHLHKNTATLSLDTSGGSLHRRGYRLNALEAPMQETLAAAIIRLSEWNGGRPLYDPMCGAGTLLCEGLMHGARIPAGFLRPRFGFQFLPDFDETLWRAVKKDADQEIHPLPAGRIQGSDASTRAVDIALENTRTLPHGERVRITQARFQDMSGLEDGVLVCNPPYGVRMGDKPAVGDLIAAFGDFLKQRCKGSAAFLYFGDRELIKRVGLKPAWKKPLRNGPLDGRLVKYELY
ncbi:MAG: class I SAM-dependent RNA methyltransferase [Desulfococcaceae bacterium]